MATLDWQLRRTGEVTLVELSVRGDRDQRVRVESRLRPVWPPRRQGVPVRGWDDHAFEGTVERDRPLVVGYASPAPPEEPPARITETGSPDEDAAVTPRTLVRTLGDARPPRDVLREATRPADDGTTNGPDDGTPSAIDDGCSQETSGAAAFGGSARHPPPAESRTGDQPATPTAWFDGVESRLDEADRLADATDADEIRAAVEAVGGIEAVRELKAQLDADRRQLREMRRRSDALADRLTAADLPLATLERVV